MIRPAGSVLDAYAAAVYARNAPALLALYTPDARVFDLWGEWVYYEISQNFWSFGERSEC